ncbi:SKA complex subunit 1-like isoform X2 [Babylonia areolata]
MNAHSLEELSHHFTEKLCRLSEALAIQACVESSEEDLRMESCQPMQTLWQDVDELSDVLILVRSKCVEQRKTLAGIQALKDQLKMLTKSLEYTTNNIPPHLPTLSSAPSHDTQGTHQNGAEQQKGDTPLPPPKPSVATSGKAASHTAAKANSAVSKQPQPPCPLIEYLTVDEFNDVPKYMKGRLSYQQVNTVIDELNKVFTAKYKLLKQKKSTMSDVNRKRYETLKMQETKDTRGVFFVVESDIKEWSGLKMSKDTLSFFTMLRHCGRLREIRGDGHIRYAMIEMY